MFCSKFDTNLALVPWTMPGGSIYVIKTNLLILVAGLFKYA